MPGHGYRGTTPGMHCRHALHDGRIVLCPLCWRKAEQAWVRHLPMMSLACAALPRYCSTPKLGVISCDARYEGAYVKGQIALSACTQATSLSCTAQAHRPMAQAMLLATSHS
jgi:hypothetical protein